MGKPIKPPNPTGVGLVRGAVPGNQHLFKPGQSGNPGGRHKEKPFIDALRKLIKEDNNKEALTKVAQKLIDLAIDGEAWAAQMLVDRLDGKAPQEIKLTRDAREMSIDDILAELAEIRALAGGTAGEDAGAGESGAVH